MTYGGSLFAAYYAQHAGYVRDGLELWLDGIDNTRSGHSTSTTVWEDLSWNNRDWTLNSGITINADNIAKSSSSTQYIASISNPTFFGDGIRSGHTVEIVVKPLTATDGCFFLSTVDAKKGLMQYSGYMITGANAFSSFDFTNDASTDLVQYSIVYGRSLDDSYAYRDNVIQRKKNSTYISSANSNAYLGGRLSGSSLYCAIHSFRVYSRPLTAEEVAQNYAVDKARFNLA